MAFMFVYGEGRGMDQDYALPMAPKNFPSGGGIYDFIYGSWSDDSLGGGVGNDTLVGGGGNEVFVGDPGKDVIRTGAAPVAGDFVVL